MLSTTISRAHVAEREQTRAKRIHKFEVIVDSSALIGELELENILNKALMDGLHHREDKIITSEDVTIKPIR